MDYYGAKDLAASFRLVRKNTITIAQEIEEKDYAFKASAASQTVAQTLSHIALMTRLPILIHGGDQRLHSFVGFDFMDFFGKLQIAQDLLTGKHEILAAFAHEGDEFGKLLDGMTEDILAERVSMPAGMNPPDKSRFEMLLSVKEHEMHHRGQLMVNQRIIGLVPHLTREREAFMAAMQAPKS